MCEECEQNGATKSCSSCNLKLCSSCSDKIHSGKRTKQHPVVAISIGGQDKRGKELDEPLSNLIKKSKQIESDLQTLKEKKFFYDENNKSIREIISNSFAKLQDVLTQQRTIVLDKYLTTSYEESIKKLEKYQIQAQHAVNFANQIKANSSINEYEYQKIQHVIDARLKYLLAQEVNSSISDITKSQFDPKKFTQQIADLESKIKTGFNDSIKEATKNVEKPQPKSKEPPTAIPIKSPSKDQAKEVNIYTAWTKALEEYMIFQERFEKLRSDSLKALEKNVSGMKKGLNPSDFSSLTDNLVHYYESEKLLKSLSTEKDPVAFGTQFLQSKL